MSLILAIEPDRRQVTQLTSLAHDTLGVELVVGDTTEQAFEALGRRVPELVLTSLLLSPKDETALAERLRELDAAGAHVQTLVIPVLGPPEGGRKRSGGLFGRLRRGAGVDTTSEGCDPAVFGTQITEYLVRAAAERAALAAAQADLEAAWAEEPPVTVAIETAPVDPADPEALFGEFAAIPIPKAAPEPAPESVPAPPAGVQLGDETFEPIVHVEPTSLVSQMRLEPVEEDWEEIAIDASEASDTRDDLHAESVDLDAFVRDLETIPTTANAQPMIPIVDLTGTETAPLDAASVSAPDFGSHTTPISRPDDDPRSDEAFDEFARIHHRDDTVSAILQAPEPAPDLADELERAVAPLEPVSGPMPGFDDTLDAAVTESGIVADAAQETVERIPDPAVEALAPLPEPPPQAAPRAGWQDLLTAIRRDIGVLKTDDAPAPVRTEFDLSKAPLVFPMRPAVAASVIAEARALRPGRPAPEPTSESPLSSEVAHNLEASLQASLSAPLAVSPDRIDAASGPEVTELQAALEQQLVKAMEGAETFEPASTPFESAPVVPALDLSAFAPAPVATPEAEVGGPLHEPEAASHAGEPEAAWTVPETPEAPPSHRARTREERRGTKGRRKRRQERAPHDPAEARSASPALAVPMDDWGFFDPHLAGFGPFVAKLNEVSQRSRHAELPRR